MSASEGTILILDDEFLVALALADNLEECGFDIMGPFASAEAAEARIALEQPDAAFLDINLGQGRTSFGLARKLLELNVPFIFVTGYSCLSIDDPDLAVVRRVGKPVSPSQVVLEARRLCIADR